MKKIVVLLIVLLTVVGLANVVGAQDWYVIKVLEGTCTKLSQQGTWRTPADCIKSYQTLQIPYKVIDDKTENGKVVQVRVIDLSNSTFITFYYGADRCNEALKAKKANREKELEKYK